MSLSKEIKIPVTCNCGRTHQVSLQDIERGQTIHCPCGTNLVLVDEGHQTGRVVKELDELDRVLKKLGK